MIEKQKWTNEKETKKRRSWGKPNYESLVKKYWRNNDLVTLKKYEDEEDWKKDMYCVWFVDE